MKNITFLITLFGMIWANAQQDLAQLNAAFAQNPKPILIEFTTDWCGYCLLQNKKIHQDQKLLAILENDYYFIELDAESEKSYHFLQREFLPNPDFPHQKTHTLVEAFVQENETVAYPFWVLLSTDLMIEWSYSGYIATNKLYKMLNINTKD